jgi:sugar phosphate isomerase/epimerase
MARIPIALQLYSVREDCKRDLPGTLAAVAKMGYEGVEFAGYYDRTASELRKMLDDLGLKVAGTHTGLNTLEADQLKATIEFNQTLGNRFLIVPWIDAEKLSSRQACAEIGRTLDGIAAQLRPLKMHTGYHNHSHDFAAVDGATPWDLLAQSTGPDVVLQLDIGNAMHGGADALAYLRKYADRGLTIHLKEFSKTKDKVIIGEGDVNWKEVFDICESTGKTEWYIVEQESYPYPPLEAAERCLKNLRAMGK